MKALIITGRMVQDQELIFPHYRLQEAGYDVTIAAESVGEFHGIQGVKFQADARLDMMTAPALLRQFNVLIIPGGVKCMEHLRLNKAALEIIGTFHAQGGVIGSICSGAQMLISARLVKGRKISGYYAMRDDIENAGAEFVDGVVTCDRIVTAPHYKYLGQWMAAVISEIDHQAGHAYLESLKRAP